MSKITKDINEVLDEFAHQIARAAGSVEALDQKVDAFKALTAYAALRHKMRLKGDDIDEDGEPTMEALREVIQGAGEKSNGRRVS